MDERTLLPGAISAVFVSHLNGFLGLVRWPLILGFVLILADLRFGIKAAGRRKEQVKKSRAIRRTFNKTVDYLCWIVIAYTIGETFGRPFGIDLLPLIILLIIYGIEIESIFRNYFESKGKKVKVNFIKFFYGKTNLIDIEDEKD